MPRVVDGLQRLVAEYNKISELLNAQERDPLIFYTPNPIQKKFEASYKRCRWIFSGNRSGKTIGGAAEVARFARGEHPFRKIEVPNIGWVISVDFPTSLEVVEPLVKFYVGEAHIKRWYKRDRMLLLTCGSKIYFKSADSGVRKFTGRKIRYAFLDEDIPEDIYKETIMRTFDAKGDIWGTVTPIYSDSIWMYNAIYLNKYKDPEVQTFFGSTYDNKDNLPIEEIKRIEGIYSADELETRLHGKFLFFAGLIYKDFEDDVNLIDPFEIPLHWIKFRIIDHGLFDPTACLWAAISPDNKCYYYREYYKTNENIETNCYWIKQLTPIEERIKSSLIDPTTIKRDPVSKTAIIDSYRANGIKPLYAAPGSLIATRINKVSVGLKNRKIFVFRNLINTINEFKTWTRDKSGKPKRGGDHALDCIGYLEVYNPKYSNIVHSNSTSSIPISPQPDPLAGVMA